MAYHSHGGSHSHSHSHSHGQQRGDNWGGNRGGSGGGWGFGGNEMQSQTQTQTQVKRSKQKMNQTVKMELYLEQIVNPSLVSIEGFIQKIGDNKSTQRELRGMNSFLNAQMSLNFGTGLDSENFDLNNGKDLEILTVAKTRVEKFKNAMISGQKTNGKRLNEKQLDVLNNYVNYMMNGFMGRDLPQLPVIDRSNDWNEQSASKFMSNVLSGYHKTDNFISETEKNRDLISKRQQQEIMDSINFQNQRQANGHTNDYNWNMNGMTHGMTENDLTNNLYRGDGDGNSGSQSLEQRRRENQREKKFRDEQRQFGYDPDAPMD